MAAPPDPTKTGLTPEDYLAIREISARYESLEERIKALGSVKATEGVKETLKSAAQLRTDLGNDLNALKDYFKDVESQITEILSITERRFRDSFKEIDQKSKENTEEIIKNLEKTAKEYGVAKEKIIEITKILTTELFSKTSADEIKNNSANFQQAMLEAFAFDENKFKTETFKKFKNEFLDFLSQNNIDSIDKFEMHMHKLSDAQRALFGEARFSGGIQDIKELRQYLETANVSSQVYQKYESESLGTAKQKIEQEIKEAEIMQQIALKNKELANYKQQQLALELPLLEYEKMRSSAVAGVNKNMEGVLDKMTRASSSTNVFGQALNTIFLNKDGVRAGISDLSLAVSSGLAQSFLSPEKAANRLFNYLQTNLVDSTFKFNALAASINRSTGGFGAEFQRAALTPEGKSGFQGSAVSGLAEYGVTLDKFGEAYSRLSTNVAGFNNLSDNQRRIIAANAAMMTNLGVSAEQSSKLMSQFMGNFKMGAIDASNAINKLAADAIGLGKDVGQYANELATSMNKVTGYGREATAIFKELSAISIATKGVISVTDLTAISDQFATFDKAAEAVAKLNMMLGGTSVSIIDMMKKNPAEQIMAIKKAATESGIEFDKLNIGYKRLLAEYFQGDITKAAAFFKMDIREAQELMDKQAASEEEVAKRKKESAAAQEKLTASIDAMKIAFTPIIGLVDKLAAGITWLNKTISPVGTFFLGLGTLVLGTIGAFRLFGVAAAAAISPIRMEIAALSRQIYELKIELASLRSGVSPMAMMQEEAIAMNVAASGAAAGRGGILSRMGGALKAPGMGMVGASIALMALPMIMGAIDSSRSKGTSTEEVLGTPDAGYAVVGPDGKVQVIEASPGDVATKIGPNAIQFNRPGDALDPSAPQYNTSNISSYSWMSSTLSGIGQSIERVYSVAKEKATEAFTDTTRYVAELTNISSKIQTDRIVATAGAVTNATSTQITNMMAQARLPDNIQLKFTMPTIGNDAREAIVQAAVGQSIEQVPLAMMSKNPGFVG